MRKSPKDVIDSARIITRRGLIYKLKRLGLE